MAYLESLSRFRRPQIKSYEWLVECYSHPLVPAKLHFFLFVAVIFEPYLTRFQTDAPMVPFMFDELSAIFKKLVGLIFKKDVIDNARSIASMLNEKWLQDSKNQLEPGLVDIGAGTKAVLASAQVAAEKKRLFRYECKQIIIKILIKLAERCPLQFSLVRVASSLDPQKMVQSSSTASLRFKKLADNLCTLNKISSKIADNAKFEYDSFQSVAIKKHSEIFLTYDPRKERMDVFLGKYVRPEFENF